MKTLIAGMALVLLGCGSDGSASGAESAAPRKPELRFAGQSPVSVAGAGFRAGEKVTLLASGGGVERKTVRADANGRFRARFRLTAGSCTAIVVQAIGARGSRAMVDVTQPDCTAP